jgi:hypothetical protein
VTWSNTWRFVVGLAVCLLLGWFAFVRGVAVPVLTYVDLGIHELGHLLTYPFPDLFTAMAGSLAQVLIPVGLAAYFLLRSRDQLGTALCLAWAGTSAQQVSMYVADAPYQRLPLLGGEHDWYYILGPEGFDALDRAATVATSVRWLGLFLLVAGLAVCVWGLGRAETRSDRLVGPAPVLPNGL